MANNSEEAPRKQCHISRIGSWRRDRHFLPRGRDQAGSTIPAVVWSPGAAVYERTIAVSQFAEGVRRWGVIERGSRAIAVSEQAGGQREKEVAGLVIYFEVENSRDLLVESVRYGLKGYTAGWF